MPLLHVGGCQNHGPFLGTLNIRFRIIIGTQKRDHNLTSTCAKFGGLVSGLRP